MKLKNKNIKLHFIEPEHFDTINSIKVNNILSQVIQEVNENYTKKTKRRFSSRNISTAKLTEDNFLEANETKIIELQCPPNFFNNDTILLEPLTYK